MQTKRIFCKRAQSASTHTRTPSTRTHTHRHTEPLEGRMAWAGNAGRRRRMAVWRMSHIGNIGVTRNRSRGLPGTVHFSQEVTSLWIVLGDSNGIKFTCSFHALSLSSSPANYSIILKELELVSQLMSSVRYTFKFWQVLTFLVLLFGFSLFNLIFVIFFG